MIEGTVDKYSEQKGLGFILGDDGNAISFERDEIDMQGFRTLNPGDRVRFDLKQSVRGPEAKNIQKM